MTKGEFKAATEEIAPGKFSVTFAKAATYTVRCKVKDPEGNKGSADVDIIVHSGGIYYYKITNISFWSIIILLGISETQISVQNLTDEQIKNAYL